MKIVNRVHYVDDAEKISSVRPAHRTFMAELGEQGLLVAAGPFADGSGALFIYEAEGLDAAEAFFAKDPYVLNGVVAEHMMHVWNIVSVYLDHFPDSIRRPVGRHP